MRVAVLAPALLSALVLSISAHADTVSFASAPGTTTYTYVSGQGALNGTSGLAVAYQNPGYAAPVSGSQYVSTSATGGDGAVGITNYTTSFTLLAGESYSGSVSFEADDSAGILINGVSVYAIDSTEDYLGAQTINLLPSYFTAGVNTITLEDSNSGGGAAAADFAGSVTGTAAVTPEPSSLVLLGTGLVGAVGAARRRFRLA